MRPDLGADQQNGTTMIIANTSKRPIFFRIHPRHDPHGLGLKEAVVPVGRAEPYTDSTRTDLTVDLRKDWAMGDPLGGPGKQVQWNCRTDSRIDVTPDGVFISAQGSSTASDGTSLRCIEVLNQMFVDVHVVLSFNGFVQEVANDVAPGASATFGGSEAGLHDVTIIPAWTEDARVDARQRDAWNAAAAVDTIVSGVGVVLAVGGAVVTFGMGAPALAGAAAFLSKSLVVAGAGQMTASFLAEGLEGLPGGLVIDNVPGVLLEPLIVCTGAKTFGSMRGKDFVVEAASPLRASLWTGAGRQMKERTVGPGSMYTDYPGRDSPGREVGQLGRGMTSTQMRRLAATRPDVAGFNTGGWFKHEISPSTSWTRQGGTTMSVKTSTPPPT